MRQRAPNRSRQSGIVLADFMAGMFLFAATMLVFAELTHSKFEMLGATHMRAQALSAAEEAIDKIRARGLPHLPKGKADKHGFRFVDRFTTGKQIPGGQGVISARSLRMLEGKGHQLYEARVTVSWKDAVGTSRVSLSTIVPLPGGGK